MGKVTLPSLKATISPSKRAESALSPSPMEANFGNLGNKGFPFLESR